MEKSKKLQPLPFYLETQLLKYEIQDDSVKLTLKLPNKIDLKELHKVLSEQFNLRHSYSLSAGNNQEYLLFIGSL